MYKFNSIGYALLTITLLNACTPTRVSDQVKLADITNWHHQPANPTEATRTDLKSWWKGFQDPLLNDLIAKAVNANHDLKIAKARVPVSTCSHRVAGKRGSTG
jgi:outer membrane protein TolC